MPTIAETPTETLLAWRASFREHLTMGLSKQARKATELKLAAVEYRLAERGELNDNDED